MWLATPSEITKINLIKFTDTNMAAFVILINHKITQCPRHRSLKCPDHQGQLATKAVSDHLGPQPHGLNQPPRAEKYNKIFYTFSQAGNTSCCFASRIEKEIDALFRR